MNNVLTCLPAKAGEKLIMSANSTIQQFKNSTDLSEAGRKLPSGPLLFCLFWICCFLLPMSCVEETDRLSRAERKIVDTLVLKETKIMRTLSDSLCELNFETSVTQVVDSILAERIEEIKKILNQ